MLNLILGFREIKRYIHFIIKNNMNIFTRQELQALETIEQSWSGDELKIETEDIRVWLTHPENRAYDGDYQVEIKINGTWKIIESTFHIS